MLTIRVMRGDRWRVPHETAANSCRRKGSPFGPLTLPVRPPFYREYRERRYIKNLSYETFNLRKTVSRREGGRDGPPSVARPAVCFDDSVIINMQPTTIVFNCTIF